MVEKFYMKQWTKNIIKNEGRVATYVTRIAKGDIFYNFKINSALIEFYFK